MTNRLTKNELDFTEDQIIDALKATGWQIPAPGPSEVKLVVDGARYSVRWKTDVAEPPP